MAVSEIAVEKIHAIFDKLMAKKNTKSSSTANDSKDADLNDNSSGDNGADSDVSLGNGSVNSPKEIKDISLINCANDQCSTDSSNVNLKKTKTDDNKKKDDSQERRKSLKNKSLSSSPAAKEWKSSSSQNSTAPSTPTSDFLDDENTWDCSVCTFRNSAEAFKCLMCDVRKGTSTRKPRINPQLVAQQVARQQQQIQQQALKASAKLAEKEARKDFDGGKKDDTSMNGYCDLNKSLKKDDKKFSNESEKRKETATDSEPNSPGPSVKSTKRKRDSVAGERKSKSKLKTIDQNCSSEAITVNNVTVIITEFQPKKNPSNTSSISTASNDSDTKVRVK